MTGANALGLIGSVIILAHPLRDDAATPAPREVRRHLVRHRHRRAAGRGVPGAPGQRERGARSAGADQPALLRRLAGAPHPDPAAQLRARAARGADPDAGRGGGAAAARAGGEEQRTAPHLARRRRRRRRATGTARRDRAPRRPRSTSSSRSGATPPCSTRPSRASVRRPTRTGGRPSSTTATPTRRWPSTSPPSRTRASATCATSRTSASPPTTTSAASWRARDLMMFLGCDDLLLPDFVATVRAAHERFPDAAIIQPGVRVIDDEGRPTDTLADRVKRAIRPRAAEPTVFGGEPLVTSLLHGDWLYWPSLVFRTDAVRGPPSATTCRSSRTSPWSSTSWSTARRWSSTRPSSSSTADTPRAPPRPACSPGAACATSGATTASPPARWTRSAGTAPGARPGCAGPRACTA